MKPAMQVVKLQQRSHLLTSSTEFHEFERPEYEFEEW